MPEDTVVEQAVNVALSLGIMLGAVVVALLLYLAVVRIVFRVGNVDVFAREARHRCRWPSRTTVALLAVLASLPFTELPEALTTRLAHLLSVGAIVAGTWTFLRLSLAVEVTLLDGLELDDVEEASPWARRRQTRVILLRRVFSGLAILVAIGGVLLTFDTARTLGQSLIASAGIIGLIAGIAAQATLGNLIAGIQLAVAEPIRIDDVVVVEGEWGNIEEITLTYVVVRTWDRRRLVLPTSFFVGNSFQNWTRNGTQVIGHVSWMLDHRAPIEAMRQEFHRQVEANPLWDGDIAVLQVIDTTSATIQVRALMTAPNSGKVWDLRCAIREGLLTWLVRTHPEALPATRLIEGAPTPEVPQTPREVEDLDVTQFLHRSPDPESVPNPDPQRTGQWPVIPRP